MGRLGCSTLVALCAALALAATAAHAASHWGPERTIFAPKEGAYSRITLAMTPGGAVLAGRGGEIVNRMRLTSSLDRGPFGHGRFFTGRYPGLVSDGTGRILAFQYRQPGDEVRIVMRSGSVTGRFGPPQVVAEGRNAFLDGWVTEASPTGDLFYAWSTESAFCACLERLHVRVRPAGAREFGPVQTLSPPDRSAVNARIAFDRRGNALLAWEQDYDVNRGRLAYALRPAGASRFGPTRTMHAGGIHGAVFLLELASNPSGRAVATWAARAEPLRDVRAAIGTVAGGFRSVERVANGRADHPHVAVDKGGEAVVTWASPRPTMAVAPPDGSFGEPRELERGRANSPVIVDDGAGTYTMSWRRFPSRALHAARRSVGSRSADVVELAPRDVFRATLAATAKHDAVLAWTSLEKGSPTGRRPGVELRGAKVALAHHGGAFGRPLTLSRATWGGGYPEDRVEVAVDAAGGAFVWWRREVAPDTLGHYGRFLIP
jgi:hypothetical protein